MKSKRNNLIVCYTTHVDSFNDLSEQEASKKINQIVQSFNMDVISITLNQKIIYTKTR